MKAIKTILTGLIIFTLFYLIGAFTQNSFNLANWSEPCRVFIASIGGSISLIIMFISYNEV